VFSPICPAKANLLFRDLANTIRDLLKRELPCHRAGEPRLDIEIKGTISWTDAAGKFHAGTYCTLPIHDQWTPARLHAFQRLRKVPITEMENLLGKLQEEVQDTEEIQSEQPMRQTIRQAAGYRSRVKKRGGGRRRLADVRRTGNKPDRELTND